MLPSTMAENGLVGTILTTLLQKLGETARLSFLGQGFSLHVQAHREHFGVQIDLV